MTDPRLENHHSVEGVDAIVETEKAFVRVGSGLPLKTVLDIDVPIVAIHSRWSRTQLAMITHKLKPEASMSQICKVIGVDKAAVSRARKLLMTPCPCCGQLREV